jgi:cell division protein FtsX
MPRKPFGWLFEIASKSNAVSIVLISNTFIWYFAVLNTLKSVFDSSPIGFWVMFVHFVAIILAAFAGTIVAKHMEKTLDLRRYSFL